jgi:DNA-binding protein H-NS
MGADYKEVGRTAKSAIAGRKVPPKYRSPNGETWAGRGAQPVWLREAIKAGKKADDFLIAKGAKKSTVKKAKRAKKKRVAVKRAKKSANNAKTKSSGATTYSYRI